MWSGSAVSLWYSSHSMTEVQKHFLGWETPFLLTASKWLQEHYLHGELGSANKVLVLVSGRDVARRLQNILVGTASAAGKAIVLPAIETTSKCVDRLVDSSHRIADETLVEIATASVLRGMEHDELRAIVGMRRPNDEDMKSWFALSQQVCSAFATLSVGGESTDRTSWPEQAQLLLTDSAKERFDTLHIVQQKLQDQLLQSGLTLLEPARLALLEDEHRIDVGGIEHIIFVGATDLPGMVMKTINKLQKSGVSVDALIRAPEEASGSFDEYGCVEVSHWLNPTIDIPDENIHVAGSPSSQAASVIRELSRISDLYTADQIVVGSTDEKLIPIIQRHLSGHGVKSRFAGGKPALEMPIAVLLQAVEKLISTKSFSSYSSFVRHPDIAKMFRLQNKTLQVLDDYSTQYVPEFIDESSWHIPNRKIRDIDILVSLHEQVFTLLNTCVSIQQDKASFVTCSSAIRELLLSVYGGETLDRTDPKLVSIQKVFSIIDTFDVTPEQVSEKLGLVDVSVLIHLLLSQLEQVAIPEYPDPESIETVGWLEAMTTDTPCLIVVGMSADLVGGNNPSDMLFPDRLRDALGLETVDRRLARDAHAVSAMQHLRNESGDLVWIVGRKNTSGDPLTPSALLLCCDDAAVLAKRAKRLVVSIEREDPEVPKQFMPEQIGGGIPVPVPSDYAFDPVKKVSVTAMKDYIACKYRFWLKHVLKLKVKEEGGTELDPMLFGSLVHKTVELFGLDTTVCDSEDEHVIARALSKHLDDAVFGMFGDIISGAIKIQVELARVRLGEVANHQAKSAQEGWRILCTEEKHKKKVDVNGSTMIISGVIDRIDVHKDTGQIRVLDYKTGGPTANDAHFKKTTGQWIDLQLPLYRLLLSEIRDLDSHDKSDQNVSLGYFRIGDQESKTGIDLLDLPDGVLEGVDDFIHQILSDIRSGNFGEAPSDPAPKYSSDFAWICQDNSIIDESEGEERA